MLSVEGDFFALLRALRQALLTALHSLLNQTVLTVRFPGLLFGMVREIPTVIGNQVSFLTLPTRCEADVNNAAVAAAAVSLICRVQGDQRRIESAVCQQSEQSSLQVPVCPPLSSHCRSARLALHLGYLTN